jgi:hypothetical protein
MPIAPIGHTKQHKLGRWGEALEGARSKMGSGLDERPRLRGSPRRRRAATGGFGSTLLRCAGRCSERCCTTLAVVVPRYDLSRERMRVAQRPERFATGRSAVAPFHPVEISRITRR